MNEVCEVYQNFILKQTYIYFQIDCNPFSDLRQRLLLRSNEPNNSDVNPRDLIDLNADQVVPRGEMSNHTRQASVIIPPLVRFTTPPPPIQPTGQSNRPARPPSRRASADTPIPSIQILEALLIGDGSGPQANGTEHVIIRKYFSDNQWFCAWCCVDYCQGREKEFCEFVYAHESVSPNTARELHSVNVCSVCNIGLMSQYNRKNCPVCRCANCIAMVDDLCDQCECMTLGHEGKTFLVRVSSIDA